MAEVMDPMHISEHVLLRELKTRFPEVPVEVVYAIMQKTLYNRERCIEALARECQNYQHVVYGTALPSYLDSPGMGESMDREYRHQYSDSNDSRGSISSLSSCHSGGGAVISGVLNSTSPASAPASMKASLSFPYLPPPNPNDFSTRPQHDPAPRSSLPLTADVYGLSRAPGYSNWSESPGYFDACRRLEMQVNASGLLPSSDKNLSVTQARNLGASRSPNSQNVRPGNITSEVTYMVGGAGDAAAAAARSQSVWVQQPKYHSETHLNVQPITQDVRLTETGEISRSSATVDVRSSNSYSSLFIHPLQVWVNSQPARPATYVSSLSSSCESLSTVMHSDDSESSVRWQQVPGLPPTSSDLARYQNGPSFGLAATSTGDDSEYLKALQICQTGNLEKLHLCFQEVLRYRQRLLAEVSQMESQWQDRLQVRESTFPTTEDIRKLQSENGQLQLDIQILLRKIDLDGDLPIGITDPEEAQSFIRSNSMRRSTSRGPGSTPVTPCSEVRRSTELPVSPCRLQEQNRQEDGDDEERWGCSACTFLNHPALKNCECCEMPRVPSPSHR